LNSKKIGYDPKTGYKVKIRECVYVSHMDAVSKGRYLNTLFIQEENEYRAHLLLDQNGYFRVNREKQAIEPGFFTITLPGDHYTVTPDLSHPSLVYYLVVFELDQNDGALASFIASSLAGETFRLKQTSRFTFDDIISRLHSGNLFQRESARHTFLSLIYSLSKEEYLGVFNLEGRGLAEKAVEFMHERKYGDFRLEELAGHLNLSVPHFIRIFKSKMGLPPMKYFARIKVEEAATLLMNSDKPLASIAEDLNFSSPAHFSKSFKQYMNLSPTQYRNNYINTLENRQERSLKEIEKAYALLNNIIDESPDLVFYKDINGIMMGCNQATCNILGMTKDEIVGRSDYELFPREKAEHFTRRDDMIFRTNKPYKNEEWMVYPDGQKRKFEVYKAPFHDTEGKILGLIGISRDITDRDIEENTRRQAQ
jgi:PAS domain S-box-containing protein